MKNPYSWPFAKHRQEWIDRADKFISLAAEGLEGLHPALAANDPASVRQYRRAARYYERSAVYYRKAGLGAMAAASWQDASECWATAGDQIERDRCDAEAARIDVYYDEEVG